MSIVQDMQVFNQVKRSVIWWHDAQVKILHGRAWGVS